MTQPSRTRLGTWGLVALALGVALLLWGLTSRGDLLTGSEPAASSTAQGEPAAVGPTPDSGLPRVTEGALPKQAHTTLSLIRAGGPYPYEADDGTFGNRERLLPRASNGYYREYTVQTPGAGDRGPRRIIAGADGDLYWTTDHYGSFRQIEEGR
ncbi:MAG: ribonuclease domain-containing protein [Ornithinibacter sp.]